MPANKQLNHFWKVAKAGRIARAAEQLHLTPQTISVQINELERALGTDLSRPTEWRRELAAAGKLALSHSDEIFQTGHELEEMLRNRAGSGPLPFRVGVSNVWRTDPQWVLGDAWRTACNPRSAICRNHALPPVSRKSGCYFPPPLPQIETISQAPASVAPTKPMSPNNGRSSSMGPPFTVIVIDEPITSAASTTPTVSRLAE